jgi:hypothetical protein
VVDACMYLSGVDFCFLDELIHGNFKVSVIGGSNKRQ